MRSRTLPAALLTAALFIVPARAAPAGPPAAPSLRAALERMVPASSGDARFLAAGTPVAPEAGPPEPKKEVQRQRKGKFFRTRTGATVLIIVGAVVAGALARRSI